VQERAVMEILGVISTSGSLPMLGGGRPKSDYPSLFLAFVKQDTRASPAPEAHPPLAEKF